MKPETINSELLNCADEGKNGCGPAAPEHFNYGDDRHSTEGTDVATQNNDLEQGTEQDTQGNP